MTRTSPALVAIALVASGAACRRTAHGIDAGRATTRTVISHDAAMDAASAFVEGPVFGPANPWGDDELPDSSAVGPEADATRATLNALRASIGFWRIARHELGACPTIDDLAETPASGFDRTTMSHDAWGSAITIECQGSRVRLRSPGPDRVDGTGDDLWSH